MGLGRLNGKIAIITGSTRGIGRAIAFAYAGEGAKVVVSGTKQSASEEVAKEIVEAGGEAIGIACDIKNTNDIDALYAGTVDKWGRVDIAVNNAGRAVFKPFVEMDYETLSDMWNTNMYGTYWCAQRAARRMIDQGGHGKIINLSSICCETAQVGLSGYAPTKAAITLMTKCIALEMAPYRINVNAIGAGTILTDINRDELDIEKDEREIPLGIGKPEDLAGLAIFLASAESDYMTGHTVFIDGGYNLT
jgi:glucose 1-dehydrogenase